MRFAREGLVDLAALDVSDNTFLPVRLVGEGYKHKASSGPSNADRLDDVDQCQFTYISELIIGATSSGFVKGSGVSAPGIPSNHTNRFQQICYKFGNIRVMTWALAQDYTEIIKSVEFLHSQQ